MNPDLFILHPSYFILFLEGGDITSRHRSKESRQRCYPGSDLFSLYLFLPGDAMGRNEETFYCSRSVGGVEEEQFVRRNQGGEQAVCGHAESGHAPGFGREFGR